MSLSELGAYLQRQREEQGLSYADIETQTRIRATYLRAIEFGEWDALPPGVYSRGLIKMYARALGLNPATVLRMYTKERPTEARLPEPQLISRPLIRQPRLSFEMALSAVVFVVAAGLLGWMVATQLWPAIKGLAQGDGAGTPTATLEGAAPAVGGETPVATMAGGAGGVRGTATSRAPAETMPAASGETPVLQPTLQATATVSPTSGIVLQVEATEDVWLSVYVDDVGKAAYYNFLKKGATPLRFAAKERVRVRTGNAGGTKVSLNGADAGSIGKKGEVKELQWKLDEHGTIVQEEL